MSKIVLYCDVGSESISEFDSLVAEKSSLVKLINFLQAINSGTKSGNVYIKADPVKQTVVFTFTDNPNTTETVTIAGTALTAKSGVSGMAGTTGTWFRIDDGITGTAANLASCINAQAVFTDKVTAAADGLATTVTVSLPGIEGQLITFSDTLTNATSAIGVTGTDGTKTTLTSG